MTRRGGILLVLLAGLCLALPAAWRALQKPPSEPARPLPAPRLESPEATQPIHVESVSAAPAPESATLPDPPAPAGECSEYGVNDSLVEPDSKRP